MSHAHAKDRVSVLTGDSDAGGGGDRMVPGKFLQMWFETTASRWVARAATHRSECHEDDGLDTHFERLLSMIGKMVLERQKWKKFR